ncbi:MAG: ligand-binding sensor domain-containing protein, partial [Limisphaerales bacterium]
MPSFRTFRFASPLCGILFAAAQMFAAAPDSPFIVDSWSAENGLPDNEANAVVQTKDGYLWIGTAHGLARFDGIHFTTFDEMNTPALKSDDIVFLFQDSRTNLWVGTQSSGLAMIHNGKIRSFEYDTSGIGPVTAASQGGDNDIYFYSQNGLARYHSGQMTYYSGVHSLQLEVLAQHWIVPSPQGGGWELGNGRIKKTERNGRERDFGPCPWKAPVEAACEDPAGNLVVGTLGEGIFWFNGPGHYRHISMDDGLSSDLVVSLCFDSEGNLWVGTDGRGLDRVKRKIFGSPENFHPWAVQSVSEDAAGGIWAAITTAGVSYWQNNVTRVYPLAQRCEAWSVLVDHRQDVWAGSRDEGLFLLRAGHFSPVLPANILGQDVFALFESRDGRLWAGSGNGLGCWDGHQWKLFDTRDGLSGNGVRAIAEDPAGHLWVGTQDSGLDYFDGRKFTWYRTTNG